MASMTPMQLSMEFMRKSGWYVEKTEFDLRRPRKDDDDLIWKHDLLRFCDILCLKRGRRLLVQTTSVSNISARVTKIRGLVTFEHAKQAGFEIQVHGWGSSKINGGLRVIDLTDVETDWSSILKIGPKRRNTPKHQKALEL